MTAIPGFIHTLTVRKASAPTTDTEGRTTLTYTDTDVTGYAAMASFDETTRASAAGERFEAVALMPLGTEIGLADQIVVPSEAGQFVAGTYEVANVRPNPHHLRVLMRRWSS